MRKKITRLFVVALLLAAPAILPAKSDLLQKLKKDIRNGELRKFSPIEAAFILSGADTREKMNDGIRWYDSLLVDIREKNLIQFDRRASAERLFMYFHSLVLKKYRERATTLFDIKEKGDYNCVSATVLFNLTCDELGLSTSAFETPTHVYTIFTNVTERLMVENTSSMGFNIMKNLQQYSRYLARFYPKNEALKIGLDRLYFYENSRGREISNIELLGLICYNEAVMHAERQQFDRAYQFVQLAQLFNSDSRSNEKFEINLYYRWGRKLFEKRDYAQAFEVMADAAYRYPDNENFVKNCRTVFARSLEQLWREKKWRKTFEIIGEFDELKIGTGNEIYMKNHILDQWIRYWEKQNDKLRTNQARQLRFD
ncbi:MAG: hypothetical protein GXO74_00125 [Calditrichaeota bacterium]|nr:hypothetical protein [Calditrichota bacterium]